MGSCVCKSIPSNVPLKTIDVPDLIDSFLPNDKLPLEIPSKRKTYIKVKSSKNIPVIVYGNKLSLISNENYMQQKTKKSINDMSSQIQETATTNKSPNKSITISEEMKITNNSLSTIKEFSPEEEQSLAQVLKNHYLFKGFNNKEIEKVIDAVIILQYDSDLMIFSIEEKPNSFYIVKVGQVEVFSSEIDSIQLLLNPKNSFGEIALVNSDTLLRQYNSKSLGYTEVYTLEQRFYLDIIKERNDNEKKKMLYDLYWFKCLKKDEQDAIICMSYIREYNKDELFKKERIKDVYYILEGIIVSILNRKFNHEYSTGDFNILYTLLSNVFPNEKYTLRCKEPTTILIIKEEVFIEIFGLDFKTKLLLLIIAPIINADLFWNQLQLQSQIEMKDFMKAFSLIEYKNEQTVFHKGISTIPKGILLLEGQLISMKTGKVVAKEGEAFKSSKFLYSKVYESDYNAKGSLVVLETTLQDLKVAMKAKAKDPEYLSIVQKVSNSFSIFNNFSLGGLLDLCKVIKVNKFNSGVVIIKSDSQITDLYLLASGTIKKTNPSEIKKYQTRIIEEGTTFGEFYLLHEINCPYEFKAKTDVVIYTLSSTFFLDLACENGVNNYIKQKLFMEESTITLNDLYYLSYLGRGRFGNVCLVHNEISFYALKAISKSFAEKQKFGVKYLQLEKKTMCSLDHPFIVKIVKTLKNDNWCFFLQEFVSGKNMSEYINNRKNKKNSNETRFYAASLFACIEYIHSKRILHRDIKPSNIMIDRNGYIKMIDFGTAIKIKERTSTIIGTPNFIAPEVLLGKGYHFPCDYWSVGVCIYNIYYGQLPFGNNSLEGYNTYKEILEKEVTFPDNTFIELNSLLSSLLNKNDRNRYSNLQTIKNHLFFKDFNWEDLLKFKLKPFYIPGKEQREDEENLKNLNSPFLSFIEGEKHDTKAIVTLNVNGTSNKPVVKPVFEADWFERF